jgi:hypothetical protein
MRSGMKRKFHVPFWRAAALVRESLTLIGCSNLLSSYYNNFHLKEDDKLLGLIIDNYASKAT